ncbi:MAG: hypothetical protein HN759_05265 [Akkermansiaceae bacterium]|nr:hypothetical protein [Akkermansiaceae bacterium]
MTDKKLSLRINAPSFNSGNWIYVFNDALVVLSHGKGFFNHQVDKG